MKILMVTKFLPLPANSGGKQRSAAVLRRLAQLGEVTICAFDDGTADHNAFRKLGIEVHTAPRPGKFDALLGILRTKSISSGRFWSRAFHQELLKTIAEGEPDCLMIAYGQLAPYGNSIPAQHRILDLHNIESALFESYSSSATRLRGLPPMLESLAMRRIEKRALKSFDTVVVVSEQDASRLPAPHPNVLVCPNGWDPSPPLPMGDNPIVTFIGLMGWAPNVDAAVWLTEEVWPHVREQRVRERLPQAQLTLVGRDPSPGVRALATHDITVTGTVPDVKPYLTDARVAVAPLRAGGGSRLKILEALNAGRPVVATSIGAEGLERFIDNGLLIVDDPRLFAQTLVDLLNDRNKAEALGRLGNTAVSNSYSWDATLAPLMRNISEAGSS
ncbi:MAG: glycosyltransferase family 4 protein [Acidimicrobiales bacterium]